MDHNFPFRRFLTMEVWKLSVKNLSRKIYFWQWNNGYSWQGHRKLNRKWLGWERNFYFLWLRAQDFHFEILTRKHLVIHRRPFAERTGLGSKILETDRSKPCSRPDHDIVQSWFVVQCGPSTLPSVYCCWGYLMVKSRSDPGQIWIWPRYSSIFYPVQFSSSID